MSIKTHLTRRVAMGTLGMAMAMGFATNAAAQSSEVASANVSACAANGSVSVTLLGLTTTLPLPCLSKAEVTAAGSDDKSAVDLDIGLLGLVNVVKLSAVHQRADYTNAADATALDGFSELAGLSLVQNLVTAQGARGTLSCDSLSGSTTLQCQAGTTIADIKLGGAPILNLPSPIPRNFTVPVGATIRLTVLGLQINVPVGGSLVLNEARAAGVGTSSVRVTHNSAHLTLAGGVEVGTLGLIKVAVEAATTPSAINVNTTRAVTAVNISDN